jgi:nicotinate phosphoribosyltransferase
MTLKGRQDVLAAVIAAQTDSYFNRTRRIVARFGDKRVTYAVFMRRPVISAPRLMTEWLQAVAAARATAFDIDLTYAEGEWVGAGEPLAYISGSLMHLSDLETILLQKIGPASVAAHNAYQMCLALPTVAKERRASSAMPMTARRTGSARRTDLARCRIR